VPCPQMPSDATDRSTPWSRSPGGRFKPVGDLRADEAFEFSLGHKLMGPINPVRGGLAHGRDGGSFTLTSGVLSQEPMPGNSATTLVNRGLERFARAEALEMPRGVRINVVSPPWVTETLEELGWEHLGRHARGPGGASLYRVPRGAGWRDPGCPAFCLAHLSRNRGRITWIGSASGTASE
jgi:NAD(P)-dependent dehydrogenase (short-subunit alcohol dehydrogenase family)